jgi:PAS domain S-box-containing protein
MKNKIKLQLNSKRQVAFYITLLTVLVSIGGYWHYGREKEQIMQQNEQTLNAIATLKAKEIKVWYRQKLYNVKVISDNPYLKEVVKSFVRSNSPIDSTRLLELLKQIQLEHGYAEVFLTSLEGDIIAATNSQTTPIHPDELKTLKHTIQNEEAISTGFFNATPNGNKQYHISFISPLNNDIINPSYAIVLRVDAANDIQPLIESWPAESQTGESFIFNKETNRIISFNEFTHQVKIETKDKLKVKNDDLLSKIYTSGKSGIYQGKDYRNVDVLAYMQAIEGTNRALISKVDKSELFKDVRGLTLQIFVWVLFAIVFSGLLIVFWFNTRQKNIYKGLLEKERELWAQQKKFKVVMDNIGDGIITLDLNGKIQYLNTRAEELTGWNLREALGRDFHEVYNVINEETGRQENNILDKVLKKGLVKELGNHTILISKSGTEIPVMDTGAPFFDASGKETGIAISFQDETEKRKQRRLLREIEARYREFFEADLTGDYIATTDGKILHCNPAFIRIMGYDTAEEIIGRNIIEFYQNPVVRQEFLTLIQNQKVIRNYTIKLKRKEGTNIICILNIVGKFDENGKLVQYFGYMYDITEQMHAEEELLKKDQLLSSVMETQRELICRFLPDTTMTFVNKAYCRLFGMNEQELIGLKFMEFVPESEKESVLSALKNLNTDNSFHYYVSSANKPDGSVMSLEWSGIAILNEQNEVVEFQAVGRDITKKLKAEQELTYQTRMQELLRKIALNYINIPLEKIDTTIHKSLEEVGKFVKADRVYVFDYDWDNGVCNNTYEWCGDGITPQINNLQNVPLEDIPFWVNPHKEGKAINIPDVFALHESDVVRQILEPQDIKSLITIPIMDETKCIGFLGFDSVQEHHKYQKNEELLLFVFAQMFVNIKKRSIIEQKLIKAKENAEESDKLKTAFLNNISHEIRTPLNGILGFGEFLVGTDISPEEKKEMLAHVQHSSNRLMNTVTNYMDMARIVSDTMEVHKKEFKLQPFFEEVIEKTRQLCAGKQINFEVVSQPENVDLTLDSDPELIRKILSPLLDNALKFTEKGSIKCGYKVNNGFVELFVQDTGKEIDSDKLEMIFDMFTQEDTSNTRGYEGSGLGLSIAKGLVDLLGGTISVTSEKGKGSTFTFTVPHAETKFAEITALAEKKNESVAGKPLVLLAEDEESNCLYMEVVLKKAGCDYLLAQNGAEAIEFCKQHPDITLVLMDIKMPVMNGVEATRLIREFRPEIPIIAITAYAQTGDEQCLLAAGCDGYLAKPIKKEKLFALIQKYFGNEKKINH